MTTSQVIDVLVTEFEAANNRAPKYLYLGHEDMLSLLLEVTHLKRFAVKEDVELYNDMRVFEVNAQDHINVG